MPPTDPPPHPPPPDFASIKEQYDAAKEAKRREKESLSRHTANHALKNPPSRKENVSQLMVWFTIISVLHLLALYLFTNGFLLTRLVLDDKSVCETPPISSSYKSSPTNGCWHQKSFDKVVIIVVDALRYDFTVPHQPETPNDAPKQFHNAFPFLYNTAERRPQNAFLLPFIADPPTTTLQRLKGLTTGTLPTFIDAGSNFAGTSIDEDNLITQARSAGKRIVQIGDDTWQALFPLHFEPNLTKSYDSFNVWDLHTVDNGVIEHLLPLLSKENSTKWDILIGHMLGVDHAGHRYGPDHPAMRSKLAQMDKFIQNVVEEMDRSTLLVVLGDHGMDSKGDHGGESNEEIQAALWMYAYNPVFGRRPGRTSTPLTATERPVAQIDLVPTLALLLGLPVPFNNLGAPIYEAFSGPSGANYRNLASVYRTVSAQIERYMKRYAEARNIDISQTTENWDSANRMSATNRYQEIYNGYSLYQQEVLRLCRSLWASFNVSSMILGLAFLTVALGTLLLYIHANVNVSKLSFPLSTQSAVGALMGLSTGLAYLAYKQFLSLPILAATTASGISLGVAFSFCQSFRILSFPFPRSWPSFATALFIGALSAGFAANSYAIWEDRVVLFLLSTLSAGLIVASLRQEKATDRLVGCYYSIFFMFLSRLVSMSRLCREEQMPYCESTYYASSTSSTSTAWHLVVPLIVAFALPRHLIEVYKQTKSYHGAAPMWYGLALPAAFWLNSAFWILNTADDQDWYGISTISWLGTLKVLLAQISLGISIVLGYLVFIWTPPFMTVQSFKVKNAVDPSGSPNTPPEEKSHLSVLGYSNSYGTRFLPLLSIWTAAVIQVSKPLGGGAVASLLVQIVCLLEILSSTSLQNSSIAPLALFLLGQLHFFSTGHQAVLSSMQWDAAFIPLREIRQPWTAFALALNTFGPQVICTLAVPAFVLWRVPGKAKDPVGKVARSYGVFLAIHGTVLLATSTWAMWLRRHLMLYRVFCPRWLVAGILMMIVDVIVVIGGLTGLKISIESVQNLFVL